MPNRIRDEQNDKIVDALKILQYDRAWVEYGLLDDEFLYDQLQQFLQSDDKSTEHYRYAAFRALLSRQDAISSELIEQYIELARLDRDRGMATSALQDLIRSSKLTREQFERLGRHRALNDSQLQKAYIRQELLRELDVTTDVTNVLFEQVFSSGDSEVQRKVLERCALSKEQLQTLRESGANRAVRNMAKQALARSRSQPSNKDVWQA